MLVTFDHQEESALNIVTFWFKPVKPVTYVAGQFTQIHLPHENMDNRGDKRWFSLSSSPTDSLLSITTKFSDNKSSTFKTSLRNLCPGTELKLAEPMGDFVIPKDSTIPLLFVAAGMGITPVHSIIKFLSDTNQQRNIHLVYSASNAKELAWHTFFESTGAEFTPIVTRSPGTWIGDTGTLSAEKIAAWAARDSRQLVYLSGPEVMIEQFVMELPKLGVEYARLVTDFFPGYPVV